MELFISITIFVYGLILGSFFNCMGLRWVVDKSIMGRSACPKCGATLRTRNLVPVFSFLFQGGKCHNCKSKISFIYPVMELATGFAYLFVYLTYGLTVDFAIGFVFMSFLLTSAVTDFTEGLVLDKIVLVPTIIIVLLTVIFKPNRLTFNLLPSIIVFILLLIPVKMGKLGSGDVALIAGSFLVHGIAFGAVTMLISSLVTMLYMFVRRTREAKFIPFWAIGNLLTYVLMAMINMGVINVMIA